MGLRCWILSKGENVCLKGSIFSKTKTQCKRSLSGSSHVLILPLVLPHKWHHLPPLGGAFREGISAVGWCGVITGCWHVGFHKGVCTAPKLVHCSLPSKAMGTNPLCTLAVQLRQLWKSSDWENCKDKFAWGQIWTSLWDKHQVKLNHLRASFKQAALSSSLLAGSLLTSAYHFTQILSHLPDVEIINCQSS